MVTVKIDTIKSKQFRALHLWFRQCEETLNAGNVAFYGGLSGKPRRWQDGDFKAGIYKPFLRHYKGLKSTTEQGGNTVNECLEALTSHISTDHGVTLPPFPSVESLSIAALLRC